MFVSNPSTVLNLPPRVPSTNSNSNSGMRIPHVSDFSISLWRSEDLVMCNVILTPLGSIPAPPLTSLSRNPQDSQLVAMRTISLKCGISVTFILVTQGALQLGQLSAKPRDS